jgi:protein involved in temperature-dependent protein secretion
VHHGLGQRLLTTDGGDVPLMEIRSLAIHSPGDTAAAEEDAGAANG